MYFKFLVTIQIVSTEFILAVANYYIPCTQDQTTSREEDVTAMQSPPQKSVATEQSPPQKPQVS